MNSFISIPDKRLFHIDHECYVIYVGNDPKDDRPFLRIGTGAGIPREALPEIGTVVITPSITGNPYLELDNVDPERPDACRYIGDGKITQIYKKFLDFLKLSRVNVQDYTELAESGNRSIVSFYVDGNITLAFKNSILFDLARRERKDHHFIEIAKSLSKKLSAYAYRYPAPAYKKPGFFIADSRFFAIRDGSIHAYGLPPHYYESLYRFGIDPDQISSVVSASVTEEMINWLKRRRSLKGAVTVTSSDIESLQGLTDLFSLRNVELKKYGSGSLEGILDASDKRFRLKSDGIDITFQSKKGAGLLRFEFTDGGARYKASAGSFRIPEGIPVSLEPESPSRDVCFRQFIDPLPGIFRGSLKPEEYRFCEKVKAALILPEQNEKAIPVPSFSFDSPFFMYFLQNCTAYAALENIRAENDAERKKYSVLKAVCEKLLDRIPNTVSHLPFTASLSLDTGALFFSYVHASFSGMLHAQHMFSVDAEVDHRKGRDEFYNEERERLARFVAELTRRRASTVMVKTPEPDAAPRNKIDSSDIRSGAYVPKSLSDPVLKRTYSRRRGSGVTISRILKVTIPAAVLILLVLGGYFLFSLFRKNGDRTASNREPVQGKSDPGVSGTTAVPGEIGEAQEPDAQHGSVERGPSPSEGLPGGEDPSGQIPDSGSFPQISSSEGSGSSADIGKRPQEQEPVREAEAASGTKPGVGTVPDAARNTVRPEAINPADMAVERYTNGRDTITITAGDMHALINRIALMNGFRAASGLPREGVNPPWFSNGISLLLPEGKLQRINQGDTIWNIALDIMHENLSALFGEFNAVRSGSTESLTARDRDRIFTELELVKQRSYCEQFIRMVDSYRKTVIKTNP